MKDKTKPDSLADIVRDLAKAAGPGARTVTMAEAEKIIKEVRREAKARKANGSPRRP